ncbi:DNA-3-methyladenine glycosylase I [Suicoccus acidiformans]|uniref:DNA-3-methyladenine glycosylase I n=1 Tax=Suicoccus acidiformans TaxID=2036206 RepID=A0A347WHN1_9LACT|nr:DNA-3-methyladenine glycosylase I [Suicoccus acidiformans]AXY24588.1 DNA-3-methyladenine glycosylase I [Suicoccus acidiformans]
MKTVQRCEWVEGKPHYYVAYHDYEWCQPTHDEQELYQWLLLESFHVGLSWQLVLSKYENFQAAFSHFDYRQIAQYQEQDVLRLMQDRGIIRHEGKIRAAITNAQSFLKVQEEFGTFDAYIWSFTDGKVIQGEGAGIPSRTLLSDQVSKDMKKRGFKFIGSVTIYSYLQAIGVVNDHDRNCAFK